RAAPSPISHHAAIAAYARGVGSKPPFAYEREKTAAATATPAETSRQSATLSRPLPVPATMRSRNGHVSRRFLLALAVAAGGFPLAAPAALAAKHHGAPPPPSAVNVYVEQVPTSCGSTVAKKPTHHVSKPATSQPTSHPTTKVPTVKPAGHPTIKPQR